MTRRQALTFFLLAALAVYGVSRAVIESWSCDDAFISYRYADNLVRGHGLVFNPGERVEGYTNPLWTLIIAGLQLLGMEPVRSSVVLGIACYLSLAGVLGLFCWRRQRALGLAFTPLAAGLVLVVPDFHSWATGGLETMLYTALATGGILATRGNLGFGRAFGAGLLLALTMFTRPDGALFALAGAISPWVTGDARSWRRKLKLSFAIGFPVAILNGAHFWWKLGYYGDLFPTSFYAKSAGDPYFSQGLLYLWLLVQRNWFLIPALIITFILARVARDRSRSHSATDEIVFGGVALMFLGYVAYTGGDFMYARRAIPGLPFVFLLLEGVAVRVHWPRLAVGLAVTVVLAGSLPKAIYGSPLWEIHDVADQTHFFSDQYHGHRRDQAVREAVLPLSGSVWSALTPWS